MGGKGVENSELSVKLSRGLQRKGGIVSENYLFIFFIEIEITRHKW